MKNKDYAVKYVKEQRREINLQASKLNVYALKFVNEESREICLQTSRLNSYAL